jgi:hypothetical protein
MLFIESGLEIEQLHRVVISNLNLSSEYESSIDMKLQEKSTMNNRAKRLSIFTIDEDVDNEDD